VSGFVFHDPSGRRARRAGLSGGVLLSFALALFAGFAATLAFAPKMPELTLKDPRILTALHDTNAHAVLKKTRWSPPRAPRAPGAVADPRPLSVGFYVSWDERSRESLRAHVEQLDVVAPQWVQLQVRPGDVTVTNDPQARAIIQASARKPTLMPLVYNAREEVWDGPLGDRVITDPTARARLLANLAALAGKRGYSGYVFDFESLSPAGLAAYPAFLGQARAAFRPLGLQVWVTAPFADRSWPLKPLQAASDVVVMMAYDQHWATGGAGPAAAQDWFQSNLAQDFGDLDPQRTVIALGAYGYDWTQGTKPHADTVTFHEAALIAHDSEVDVPLDPASLNPHFAYADEQGRPHEVWFLDAVTFYNQMAAANPWRPKGYGLWRLGSEDPGVWSLLDKPFSALSPQGLRVLGPGQDVDFDGTGEVLRVSATPTPGKRSFTVDPRSRLIESEHYDVLPTSYVLQRYGAHPGLVALTFDDGPDRRWTPKILDILKARHAPATFFVIGQNMQTLPDLVEREVREGHMVGGHTWTHPNIGETGPAETALELNATQRLFETLTGKSQRLFRPPYFGDAEPSTPSEVAPLLAAQKLGYLIVGLRIDPDDWQKPDPRHIVARTLERLADTNPETGGQVVLLHDSGGDRSRTVEALPALIDALRAHGYRLVTVADLAGMTPAQALPSADRAPVSLFLDRMGFGFARAVQAALYALFLSAIALGAARLALMASLALVHRSREGRTPPLLADPDAPLISVLIPCFNEEKVIAASVRRVLGSTWPRLEVIVLDDGSTDRTAEEVRTRFADESRVRLMSFPNGGKARALNRGLAAAGGQIVVALDADTQFEPKTITKLARWFADPTVGAVAGDALVGNRVNLITRWQALEYVVAQNLERRALAALGAVTVVPGAVGAWRRSAIEAIGGYPDDTLAEDQDLTLAVQRAGWRVEFDPDARAWTEAPDTVRGLLKQRFRWSFGTLQCLWKHRGALFDRAHPVLGFLALPQIWLFQIVLACAAPLVDLAMVWSLVAGVVAHAAHPDQWNQEKLILPLAYWAIFVLVDLSACALGLAMERRAPWRDILWTPLQRFGYRQLMYYVVAKSVVTAVRGPLVGWGALERRATVAVDAAA
jgi:spore germination protein YaaH/peptidoglycan/xylan/chitin deacetylase (PgdA/CDA1 family)/GT2 family glycosyltransferase